MKNERRNIVMREKQEAHFGGGSGFCTEIRTCSQSRVSFGGVAPAGSPPATMWVKWLQLNTSQSEKIVAVG